MSEEVREKEEEEMTQNIIKQARELVEAIRENKELFEKIKEVDEDVERLRLIAKELEAFHEIIKNKKLSLEEIAMEFGSIKYTARIEVLIDRKDVELYAPSGTLLLRLPVEDAKSLTLDQLVIKPFQDYKAIQHLYERFIETLDIITKQIADKFYLVEKINSISSWIDENDP